MSEAANKMTEQESLKLINEMIGKAKRSYITTGAASMVWGILIVICSLLTWYQVYTKTDFGFDVWLLVFLALIPQIYFSLIEKKKKNFVSHDEKTMTVVWTTFAICVFILSFYNGKFGDNNGKVTALFMMLYGIPTFITGGIFNFKPMILGGIICWVLAVVSMYTDMATDMLFMAACGLFAWLIPGIILWNRYKKQQRTHV
ncbi:MAG: hypothetical protein WDM90_17570 [Ferruginibacter sp.]